MSSWNKWLWGGLGWTIGGPIGGIIGFALGAITEKPVQKRRGRPPSTQPGDFGTVLLVLQERSGARDPRSRARARRARIEHTLILVVYTVTSILIPGIITTHRLESCLLYRNFGPTGTSHTGHAS